MLPAARHLLDDARDLLRALGPERRPSALELQRSSLSSLTSALIRNAVEAVGWVADERGLSRRAVAGRPRLVAAH